jgi:hypothetical protein
MGGTCSMNEERNAYKDLVEEPERTIMLGRSPWTA